MLKIKNGNQKMAIQCLNVKNGISMKLIFKSDAIKEENKKKMKKKKRSIEPTSYPPMVFGLYF